MLLLQHVWLWCAALLLVVWRVIRAAVLRSCSRLVAVVGPVVAAVVGVVALPVQARLQGQAKTASSKGSKHE
jgi:hypothetical protein